MSPPVGTCTQCGDVEPLVQGRCAECWTKDGNRQLVQSVNILVEVVRSNPTGAKIVGAIEDWARGRAARLKDSAPGPEKGTKEEP